MTPTLVVFGYLACVLYIGVFAFRRPHPVGGIFEHHGLPRLNFQPGESGEEQVRLGLGAGDIFAGFDHVER